MSWYSEKLKDVRWQKKRLEVLERDKFTCQWCRIDEERAVNEGRTLTLHVHHTYYEKGLEPWEYPSGSYVTLCANCHEQDHEIDRKEAEKGLVRAFQNQGYRAHDLQSLSRAVARGARPIAPIRFSYAFAQCVEEQRLIDMIYEMRLNGDFRAAARIFLELMEEQDIKVADLKLDELPDLS